MKQILKYISAAFLLYLPFVSAITRRQLQVANDERGLQRDALLKVYASAGGAFWTFPQGASAWGTTPNPCDWAGVVCCSAVTASANGSALNLTYTTEQVTRRCSREGRLMALALRGVNLSGILPHDLAALAPEVLLLADNPGLHGQLPPALLQVNTLVEIDVRNTSLTCYEPQRGSGGAADALPPQSCQLPSGFVASHASVTMTAAAATQGTSNGTGVLSISPLGAVYSCPALIYRSTNASSGNTTTSPSAIEPVVAITTDEGSSSALVQLAPAGAPLLLTDPWFWLYQSCVCLQLPDKTPGAPAPPLLAIGPTGLMTATCQAASSYADGGGDKVVLTQAKLAGALIGTALGVALLTCLIVFLCCLRHHIRHRRDLRRVRTSMHNNAAAVHSARAFHPEDTKSAAGGGDGGGPGGGGIWATVLRDVLMLRQPSLVLTEERSRHTGSRGTPGTGFGVGGMGGRLSDDISTAARLTTTTRKVIPSSSFEAKRSKPPGSLPELFGREVTLVATDVEGSTELWEWQPDTMNTALTLHDRLVRLTLAACCGYEVTTEGDAFLVAFHEPVDAVRWALLLQSALLKMDWPPLLLEHPLCRPRPLMPIAAPPAPSPFGSSGAAAAASDAPLLVLFKGLAVRMGIATGVPSAVREHPVTRRMQYTGAVLRLATGIAELGAGGQVLLEPLTFKGIHNKFEELDVEESEVQEIADLVRMQFWEERQSSGSFFDAPTASTPPPPPPAAVTRGAVTPPAAQTESSQAQAQAPAQAQAQAPAQAPAQRPQHKEQQQQHKEQQHKEQHQEQQEGQQQQQQPQQFSYQPAQSNSNISPFRSTQPQVTPSPSALSYFSNPLASIPTSAARPLHSAATPGPLYSDSLLVIPSPAQAPTSPAGYRVSTEGLLPPQTTFPPMAAGSSGDQNGVTRRYGNIRRGQSAAILVPRDGRRTAPPKQTSISSFAQGPAAVAASQQGGRTSSSPHGPPMGGGLALIGRSALEAAAAAGSSPSIGSVTSTGLVAARLSHGYGAAEGATGGGGGPRNASGPLWRPSMSPPAEEPATHPSGSVNTPSVSHSLSLQLMPSLARMATAIGSGGLDGTSLGQCRTGFMLPTFGGSQDAGFPVVSLGTSRVYRHLLSSMDLMVTSAISTGTGTGTSSAGLAALAASTAGASVADPTMSSAAAAGISTSPSSPSGALRASVHTSVTTAMAAATASLRASLLSTTDSPPLSCIVALASPEPATATTAAPVVRRAAAITPDSSSNSARLFRRVHSIAGLDSESYGAGAGALRQPGSSGSGSLSRLVAVRGSVPGPPRLGCDASIGLQVQQPERTTQFAQLSTVSAGGGGYLRTEAKGVAAAASAAAAAAAAAGTDNQQDNDEDTLPLTPVAATAAGPSRWAPSEGSVGEIGGAEEAVVHSVRWTAAKQKQGRALFSSWEEADTGAVTTTVTAAATEIGAKLGASEEQCSVSGLGVGVGGDDGDGSPRAAFGRVGGVKGVCGDVQRSGGGPLAEAKEVSDDESTESRTEPGGQHCANAATTAAVAGGVTSGQDMGSDSDDDGSIAVRAPQLDEPAPCSFDTFPEYAADSGSSGGGPLTGTTPPLRNPEALPLTQPQQRSATPTGPPPPPPQALPTAPALTGASLPEPLPASTPRPSATTTPDSGTHRTVTSISADRSLRRMPSHSVPPVGQQLHRLASTSTADRGPGEHAFVSMQGSSPDSPVHTTSNTNSTSNLNLNSNTNSNTNTTGYENSGRGVGLPTSPLRPSGLAGNNVAAQQHNLGGWLGSTEEVTSSTGDGFGGKTGTGNSGGMVSSSGGSLVFGVAPALRMGSSPNDGRRSFRTKHGTSGGSGGGAAYDAAAAGTQGLAPPPSAAARHWARTATGNMELEPPRSPSLSAQLGMIRGAAGGVRTSIGGPETEMARLNTNAQRLVSRMVVDPWSPHGTVQQMTTEWFRSEPELGDMAAAAMAAAEEQGGGSTTALYGWSSMRRMQGGAIAGSVGTMPAAGRGMSPGDTLVAAAAPAQGARPYGHRLLALRSAMGPEAKGSSANRAAKEALDLSNAHSADSDAASSGPSFVRTRPVRTHAGTTPTTPPATPQPPPIATAQPSLRERARNLLPQHSHRRGVRTVQSSRSLLLDLLHRIPSYSVRQSTELIARRSRRTVHSDGLHGEDGDNDEDDDNDEAEHDNDNEDGCSPMLGSDAVLSAVPAGGGTTTSTLTSGPSPATTSAASVAETAAATNTATMGGGVSAGLAGGSVALGAGTTGGPAPGVGMGMGVGVLSGRRAPAVSVLVGGSGSEVVEVSSPGATGLGRPAGRCETPRDGSKERSSKREFLKSLSARRAARTPSIATPTDSPFQGLSRLRFRIPGHHPLISREIPASPSLAATATSFNVGASTARNASHSLIVIDMGVHRLKISALGPQYGDLYDGVQVIQLLPEHLKHRAAYHPPLKSQAQLAPSFFDAPGAGQVAERSGAVFCAAVREILQLYGAYECQEYECTFMVACTGPRVAAEAALALHEWLVQADWPTDLLEEHSVGRVELSDDGRPLLRGFRAKVGIFTGVPLSVVPHATTGRADYFGALVNRAARLMAGAKAGQTLLDKPAGMEVLKEWRQLAVAHGKATTPSGILSPVLSGRRTDDFNAVAAATAATAAYVATASRRPSVTSEGASPKRPPALTLFARANGDIAAAPSPSHGPTALPTPSPASPTDAPSLSNKLLSSLVGEATGAAAHLQCRALPRSGPVPHLARASPPPPPGSNSLAAAAAGDDVTVAAPPPVRRAPSAYLTSVGRYSGDTQYRTEGSSMTATAAIAAGALTSSSQLTTESSGAVTAAVDAVTAEPSRPVASRVKTPWAFPSLRLEIPPPPTSSAAATSITTATSSPAMTSTALIQQLEEVGSSPVGATRLPQVVTAPPSRAGSGQLQQPPPPLPQPPPSLPAGWAGLAAASGRLAAQVQAASITVQVVDLGLFRLKGLAEGQPVVALQHRRLGGASGAGMGPAEGCGEGEVGTPGSRAAGGGGVMTGADGGQGTGAVGRGGVISNTGGAAGGGSKAEQVRAGAGLIGEVPVFLPILLRSGQSLDEI